MKCWQTMLNVTRLFLVAVVSFSLIPMQGQALQPSEDSSTPQASAPPRFGMNVVGDFPNGYFEVSIEPGETSTGRAIIVNEGTVDAELLVYAANVSNPANGGFSPAEITELPVGTTTWISVDSQPFTVPAGESRTIEFDVSVPKDALPGQYVTSIVASTKDAIPIEGAEFLKQILRSAIPLVIYVPGPLKAEFSLGSPTAQRSEEAVYVSIPLTNSGNILVKPQGTFQLTDADGRVIIESDVAMQSVYGGNTSSVLVAVPSQMESGEFYASVVLEDPASGVTASIEPTVVQIEEPEEPELISLGTGTVTANADEIVFATVSISIVNDGVQLPATDVVLEVLRDGELVDEYSLASNQVLLVGENTYTSRYIPSEGVWEPGDYAFNVVMYAVDPNGGQRVELLNQPLDDTIVVP